MALNVVVVSREKKLWSGSATYVSAPSIEGSVGIMPGRQPLLAVLGQGTLRILQDDKELYRIETEEGFVSVDSDRVIVALDYVGSVEDTENFARDIS